MNAITLVSKFFITRSEKNKQLQVFAYKEVFISAG